MFRTVNHKSAHYLAKAAVIFLLIFAMLLGDAALCLADAPVGPEEIIAQMAAAQLESPPEAPPVEIAAKAAVLMDASTGKVLIGHNQDVLVYPASVTKIMPLLLVGEALDGGKIRFSDPVTASGAAAGKGGSQIWLKEGETMTVEELLKATAIYSANDACTALGEYLSGSEEGFVSMMNARAAELGMTNTTFVNCTGLDDDTTEHLTSAYDVAVMSRELLKHDCVTQFSTIWMDSLRGGATELVNTNKLVRFFEGTTGLKTGTTSKAGCCVSASAKRGDTHLIAVVMGSGNSDDRFNTAKRLLNWGFANYATVTPKIDPALIAQVRVLCGEERFILPKYPQEMTVLVPKGSENDLQQCVDLALDVEAPVEAGQKIGTLCITMDGEVLAEYTLTAPQAVPKLTFKTMLLRLLSALCG